MSDHHLAKEICLLSVHDSGIHSALWSNSFSTAELKWSWSLSLRLVYPVLHKPSGATITSRSTVRIRINFWRMVGLSPLEIGPMHLSVEGLRLWDWSYPVLQYLREWPTPTIIIVDMSTVVKPQQPTSSSTASELSPNGNAGKPVWERISTTHIIINF